MISSARTTVPQPTPDCRSVHDWLEYWHIQRGLYAGAAYRPCSTERATPEELEAEEMAAGEMTRAFQRAVFLRADNAREVVSKLALLRDAVQRSAACDCHDVLAMLASIEADLEGLTGAAASNQQTPPAGLVKS